MMILLVCDASTGCAVRCVCGGGACGYSVSKQPHSHTYDTEGRQVLDC